MAHVHEHQLSNGMTILCCRQSHLHSLAFGLYFRGGTLYENRQNQGVTHLIEHLCFQSLGGIEPLELNRRLDRMGAELEAASYADAMVFSLRTQPRCFDEVLDLLLHFFADREWTAEEIDRAREVVLRQVEIEDFGFEDEIDLRYRVTDNGAFPVMGTEDSVRAMTPAMIRRWQRLLLQPQNACLCVTGNFSYGMEDALIQAFEELANHTDEPPFVQQPPEGFCLRNAGDDYVEDAEGDGPAHVHIAFDMDDNLVFPLVGDVLNAMTGADNDSILFMTLREEQGFLAEIESTVEELGVFRRLVIRYDVPHERLEESLRRVFDLLRRLSLYVRAARLQETRVQFTSNLVFWEDDAVGMNSLMGHSFLSDDLSRCDLEARSEMYDDLSLEDIQNAAQSVFRPENLVISIQRDPEKALAEPGPLLLELRKLLE